MSARRSLGRRSSRLGGFWWSRDRFFLRTWGLPHLNLVDFSHEDLLLVLLFQHLELKGISELELLHIMRVDLRLPILFDQESFWARYYGHIMELALSADFFYRRWRYIQSSCQIFGFLISVFAMDFQSLDTSQTRDRIIRGLPKGLLPLAFPEFFRFLLQDHIRFSVE